MTNSGRNRFEVCFPSSNFYHNKNNKQQTCNQTPFPITPSQLPHLDSTPKWLRSALYPFTMSKFYARKSPIPKEIVNRTRFHLSWSFSNAELFAIQMKSNYEYEFPPKSVNRHWWFSREFIDSLLLLLLIVDFWYNFPFNFAHIQHQLKQKRWLSIDFSAVQW